jgi:hypothetical protein
MHLPTWLPIVLWFGAIIVAAVCWQVVDIRFRSAHQRRYRGYRTLQERLELFGRDPRAFLQAEPAEWGVRIRSYSVRADDPEVERLRRLSVGLFLATVLVVFGGLFASFILVAAVQRILNGYALIVIPQIGILAFWVGLFLKVLRQRDHSPLSVVILLCAVAVAVGLLVVTLVLTK